MGAASGTMRVLPDTCLDFVFSRNTGLQVVGTMTRALVLGASSEWVVGVRIRAGMMRGFLDAPGTEFTDRSLAVQALWGKRGRALEEQLQNSAGPEEMLQNLGSALVPASDASPAQRAVAHLAKHAGEISVEDSCRFAGLSARQFRRRCLEETGVGPKRLARIGRFRRACLRITPRLKIEWADFAAEAGYYDQAHLIHEFQEFSGLTPAGYIQQLRA